MCGPTSHVPKNMKDHAKLGSAAMLAAVSCMLGCAGNDPPESVTRDRGTALVDAGLPPDAARSADASADGGSATRVTCTSGEDEDRDRDGFSRREGDCNDCLGQVNPGAYDFGGDTFDDDCSGSPAREADGDDCDQALALDSRDARDAARALGLCRFASEASRAWGVVSARFTDASGKGELTETRSFGLLPSFGAARPRAGEAMLALSSGVARAPGQPGYTPDCDLLDATCSGGGLSSCTGGAEPPPGYPKESSACPTRSEAPLTETRVYNQSALELRIRVPNNVSSFGFESIFYTYEYPNSICSQYNDFFVVFKEPKPAGVADGNIVFDLKGDPIGVNTVLLAVCDPSLQSASAQKRFGCEQGTKLLQGTGYGRGETSCYRAGGAATGWLDTKAPVKPGEIITLRFAIWDTNDPSLDSTVLLDHFRWSKAETPVETSPVPAI